MARLLILGLWFLAAGHWRVTSMLMERHRVDGFKKYFLVYVYQKRKYDEHIKK